MFQERLSDAKHCVLQSNIGYTQVSLELSGVHDNKDDEYMHIKVYLMYHSHNARPCKVEVESTGKNQLNNDKRLRMKSSLKIFKIYELKIAFKMLMEDNSEFTWIQTDDDDDNPMDQSVRIHFSTST